MDLRDIFDGNEVFLGSSSRARRTVLQNAGLHRFSVVVPDVDERKLSSSVDDGDSVKLVQHLANAKADACLIKLRRDREIKDGLLICSDQLALYNGEVRAKPTSNEEARQFLRSYNLSPVSLVMAVVVVNLSTMERSQDVAHAEVHFSNITEAAIDGAIATGTIFSCCGGFAIEDPSLEPHIRQVKGGEDGVMGMPLALTKRLLNEVLVSRKSAQDGELS